MLDVARAIESGLSHDPITTQLWTAGVFQASRDTIASLIEAAERSDQAVLIFGADDVRISRNVEEAVPRDNVIFELGLFIGAVGRERTFVVLPRGVEISVPTDLLGLVPLTYDTSEGSSLDSRIGPVCTELRQSISKQGVR